MALFDLRPLPRRIFALLGFSCLISCAPTAGLLEPGPASTTSALAGSTQSGTAAQSASAFSGRTVIGGIQWADTARSGVAFMAEAINQSGITTICGTRVSFGGKSRRFDSQVANDFAFAIDGTPVLRNFAYFARATSEAALSTTQPNCRQTGIPWRPDFATAIWELRPGNQTVYSF